MTIDFPMWSFPLSLILTILFVLTVAGAWQSSQLHRWVLMFSSKKAACGWLLIISLLTAVEGTWKIYLYHTWGFVAVVLLMSVSLGWTALYEQRMRQLSVALYSHIGMFLILVGGLFGAADVSDSQLVVHYKQPEHLAVSQQGKIVPLPFAVQLKDFQIDYYEDGMSPRQYTSTLLIDGKEFETSVNHPCSYKGYDIYQSGFDYKEQQYSILKVVRDPWIYVVYVGMLLLILGALMEVRKTWHSRSVLPLVAILTVVFSLLSVARINFGTLMPALRSLWFLPHLIVYMIAYSLLAIASVWCLVDIYRKETSSEMPQKLLVTSSALLLIGMLCGSVWAKAAWGQYWTWDAKECWAAVTWLLTLVGIHLPQAWRHKALAVVICLTFLAMQITWYGVNYLPSAKLSLHTYN